MWLQLTEADTDLNNHLILEAHPMAFLTIERDGGILTVTMNQPETRNALTGNTAVDEFVQLCDEVRKDTSVKVLILTGAGPIFSSGGNVKDMQRFFDDALTPDLIREEYRNGIQRIPNALYQLDVPVICAVNGPAIGAGLDLTCMCDIRIASDNATFAESFVRVGIVPGDGGAWLLPRAVGMAKASEMAFTGEAISAQEALGCGLVSRVVAADELLPTAKALAQKIASNPAAVMRMTKRLLREGQNSSLVSLLELSAGYQAIAHKTADHREAVMAFVEKRKPNFV
jgi:enoyl-CoA hydratase/carnithine racemase